MNKEFLPIGSVVLLKGGEKKLMITGFCTIPDNSPGDMYDYCGCLYPEGVISSDEIYVFNHDQIEEVSFIGYEDDESKEFQVNLNKAIIENNNSENNIINDNQGKKPHEEIERL